MGREIRRVPPNWEHPVQECRHRPTCFHCFHPMYAISWEDAVKAWKAAFILYEAIRKPGEEAEFWEADGNPPDRDYYVTYKQEDATWFQVYETVSEGTPVTPPFATEEELVDYLVENGDFWDQQRAKRNGESHPKYSREAAERFVKVGWAPSMVLEVQGDKSVLKIGIEGI